MDWMDDLRYLNHPLHLKHRLELLTNGAPHYSDKNCCLCGDKLKEVLYHCSNICDFSLHTYCAISPPPLTQYAPRIHEHKLTLMPTQVSFPCNACGTVGKWSPYVCSPCGFMVHQSCTHLPRVIIINRHEHRISHTILGPEIQDQICGVCRHKVNGKYGAYSCSTCTFAAHSKCATWKDVWDGIELEGKADEVEDVAPFKVIGDGVIKHFSHDFHNLRLDKGGSLLDGGKRCQGCVQPVYSDPFYSCTECDFILHETCANLPRKRHHVLSSHPLTLKPCQILQHGQVFQCAACYRFSSGFRYQNGAVNDINFFELDIQCGSFMEPFLHKSHPHPLFYSTNNNSCKGCGVHESGVVPLGCDDCDYALCFKCATLPYVVKHKYDDHLLTLCCGGEDANRSYWCEICAKEMDPKKWSYDCEDCGFTAHLECALGDFHLVIPGHRITLGYRRCELVPNNRVSRPFCVECHRRCQSSFILQETDEHAVYICSLPCLLGG